MKLFSLALGFELRCLLRSRSGLLALASYLLVGVLAVVLGQRYVADWEQAIELAQTAQQESVSEAESYFQAGKGPENRPWVDLTKSTWQDHYAGTRVHREPASLAGIAAGSVDSAPVAFRVSRRADPSSGGGARIENPELAMGTVDLTFVLSVLSPLLIGVLGVGIGGREREEGIDRLITVQSGSVRGWLLARLLVVTALVAGTNLVLCLAAGLAGGAEMDGLLLLLVFGLVYTVLWGGLLAIVSTYALSVRASALSFGALWLCLCVLLPSLAAEASLARVQTDFGLAETLEARSLSYEAYNLAVDDVKSQVYRWQPELAGLPAASRGELGRGARRLATGAVLVAAMDERVQARQAQSADAQAFSESVAWGSPAIALTLALERLAGVGPEAAAEFQAFTMQAVVQRVRWVLRHAWLEEPLKREDFDALVSAAPGPLSWTPRGLNGPAWMLAVWALMSWFIAAVGLRRSDGGRTSSR